MGNYRKPGLGASLVALTVACAANGAWAQQAPAQASPPKQEAGLEEILVTAERRSEPLQKVPIAITAIDSAQLQATGVTRVDDLQKLVPGLNVAGGLGIFGAVIRGVGASSNPTTGSESGLAQYIDDVYMMDQYGSLTSVGDDVSRVEVLKGPQGTLFGRNSTGGLINFITGDPQTDPLLRVKAGYESYQTILGSVYATGALTSNLKGSILLSGHEQGEGFGRDIHTGQQANYIRNYSGRFKLLWTPADNDRITFAGDALVDTSDGATHTTVAKGTTSLFGGVYPGDYNSELTFRNYPKGQIWGGSVRWEHTFANGILFKSISAYRNNRISWGEHYDLDYAPINFYGGPVWKTMRSFQQEFLVQGSVGRLDYTAGIFYFTARQHWHINATGIVSLALDAYTGVDTYAPYGQVDYHVTDKDTLTGGVRYTVDKEMIHGGLFGADDEQSKTFPATTWRAAYKHEFTNDLMAYVSNSRGFKSGVFNPFTVTDPPASPETLDDYEVGVKAKFFDNRLRLNLSGFYYDYTNLQVLTFSNGNPLGQTSNAATAEVYGTELDSEASIPVPVGALQLAAGLSLLHARFTSFPSCAIITPNPPPALAGTSRVGACSGNTLPYAPTVTTSIGVNYTVPLAKLGGELGTSVNYYHSSKYYFSPDNVLSQGAYEDLDAEISYVLPDDRTRVKVYGRNLTDEHVISRITSSAQEFIGGLRPPRTFGVEFQYTFH